MYVSVCAHLLGPLEAHGVSSKADLAYMGLLPRVGSEWLLGCLRPAFFWGGDGNMAGFKVVSKPLPAWV